MSDSNEDETYECPLCFVPIAGSIMQCKNGHISCEGCHRDCKEKFQGKCPTCNIPLDDIRNRALEEMRDRLAKKEAKRSAPKNKDAEPKKKAAKHSHEASPASPLPGTAKDRPLEVSEEEEAKSLLPGLHAWQDEREAASKVDRMIEERSIDIKTYFQIMTNPLFQTANYVLQKCIEGLTLVMDEENFRTKFNRLDGLKVILDAMVKLRRITDLNFLALTFIAKLYKGAHGKKIPQSAEIINQVCRAMINHKCIQTIQSLGCLAIYRCTRLVPITDQRLAEDGFAAVIKALGTRFAVIEESEEAALIRHAFLALASISYWYPGNKDALLKLGAIELIEERILENDSDEGLFRAGVKALACLCATHPGHKEQILQVGLIKIVVDSMDKFAKIAEVQRAGCLFFARMAQNHSLSKARIAADGGTDQVIRAMSQHKGVRPVEEAGILYFAMACENPATRRKVAGLKVVLKAMQTLKGNEGDGIHCQGCLAISSFGFHCTTPEERASLAQEAVPIVSIVIRSGVAQLQAIGLLALRNLVQDNSEAKALPQKVREDVCTNVRIALKDFRKDVEVQRQGKTILKLFD